MRFDRSHYSRVEIIRGIAPVRPGPSYGYLSPARSGPETGFVAICIGFRTKNCDVLPHIMQQVTFTSILSRFEAKKKIMKNYVTGKAHENRVLHT